MQNGILSNKALSFKKRKQKIVIRRIFVLFVAILSLLILGGMAVKISEKAMEKSAVSKARDTTIPDWVDSQIIEMGCGGREGKELKAIKNIVVHYVGNPNTSAQNNRDYFNKESTKVSSHFIVGLEGEIIQCLPINEISAASNWRNNDTISIEVCHPDESGEFNKDTYNSLVKLTAWLCHAFYLGEDDVIRHYDITGKMCPVYYVENEKEWKTLKEKIGKATNEF